MAYCNLEDLKGAVPEERIAELSNDENPEIIDEETVNKQISKADSRINGYIRGRYAVPLDPVPDEIKDVSVDIAAYFLYTRQISDECPKSIKDKYADAIEVLKSVQAGKFTLDATPLGGGEDAETGITGSGEYRSNKTAEDRIFSKDVLNRF